MARLLTVTAGLALLAVLFAGCGGGGDDHVKVEASLRDYFGTVIGEETGFPIGLGVPRVRHKACKDQHVKVQKGQVLYAGPVSARFPEEVALWSCVVTLGRLAQLATVAVTGSTDVVWAKPFPLVFVQDRGGQLVYAPDEIGLGASTSIDRLKWTGYGTPFAVGRGRFPQNDCTPSCADGKITWRPATVRLKSPALCQGKLAYMLMAISVPGISSFDGHYDPVSAQIGATREAC
jgi:hypothetical protein